MLTACALVVALLPWMEGADAASTVDRIVFANDGDGDLETG